MACGMYICLFAIVATVTAQMMMDKPMVCPMNERYVRCMYEVCHKTCENMRKPPLACPMLTPTCMDPGCVCNIGYLRNNLGQCVSLGNCDCPPNEEYYKCHHRVCYKTCQDLKRPPPCASIAADCFAPACVCNEGLLRNDAGMCIPSQECPRR